MAAGHVSEYALWGNPPEVLSMRSCIVCLISEIFDASKAGFY